MESHAFKIICNITDEVIRTIVHEDYDKGLLEAQGLYEKCCRYVNNFGTDFSLTYKEKEENMPNESGIIF
tara:strand:+ start:293 stop:502 length:210 start_codon:yes stop_codon:yes gene_type:complete